LIPHLSTLSSIQPVGMSAAYCGQANLTDASGIIQVAGVTVPVGPLGYVFNFQVAPPPPSGFFSIKGIYSMRTVPCVKDTFDRLYSQLLTLDASAVDPFNNRNMNIFVQQLSYKEQLRYEQGIRLFQKVYDYNLAAYIRAGQYSKTPLYYTFVSSEELSRYREANAYIIKLYFVNDNYPLTSLFYLPFPPFCN
jgi:tetratricopeptide (TPR) repeat protein